MPRPVKDWRVRLAREFRAARRLFVLGIGNPDRADDGAGSLCVQLLARDLRRSPPSDSSSRKPALEEVQVLDGGEVPESATGLIREFRPTHVLIIDAASAGHEPGTIFFIDKKKIADEDITTHRIPLLHLVRYLEESVGCRVVLLGIEPGPTLWGSPMSRAVRNAAGILADAIGEDLLENWVSAPARCH